MKLRWKGSSSQQENRQHTEEKLTQPRARSCRTRGLSVSQNCHGRPVDIIGHLRSDLPVLFQRSNVSEEGRKVPRQLRSPNLGDGSKSYRHVGSFRIEV